MTPIQFRNLARHEASQMAEMGAELFIDTFGHLYTPSNLQEFLDRVHSPKGVLEDMDAGRVYWVAEQDGRWIGYCKGGPVGVPIDVGVRKGLELKQLYVRREYHGSGVSHQLMDLFLKWAEASGAEDIYVSCWSLNHRGIAFYRKYGFEVVGSYIFYVGDHQDDEWILKASLARIPTTQNS